jgi:hypothetical protein
LRSLGIGGWSSPFALKMSSWGGVPTKNWFMVTVWIELCVTKIRTRVSLLVRFFYSLSVFVCIRWHLKHFVHSMISARNEVYWIHVTPNIDKQFFLFRSFLYTKAY